MAVLGVERGLGSAPASRNIYSIPLVEDSLEVCSLLSQAAKAVYFNEIQLQARAQLGHHDQVRACSSVDSGVNGRVVPRLVHLKRPQNVRFSISETRDRAAAVRLE